MRIKPFILLAVALVSRHGSIRGEDITFKQINYVETVIDSENNIGVGYWNQNDEGDLKPFSITLPMDETLTVAEDNTFEYNNNRYYRLGEVDNKIVSAMEISHPIILDAPLENSIKKDEKGFLASDLAILNPTDTDFFKKTQNMFTRHQSCPTITQSDLDHVKELIEKEKKRTKIFYVEIVFDRFNNLAIKFSPKESTLSAGGELEWRGFKWDEKLEEGDKTIEANGLLFNIIKLYKEKNIAVAYQFSDSPTIDTLANSHITESDIYIIPADLKNPVMIESKKFIFQKPMVNLFNQEFFKKLKESLDQQKKAEEPEEEEEEEEEETTDVWDFDETDATLKDEENFYVKLEQNPKKETTLSVTKIDKKLKEGIDDDYWLIVKLENLKKITTADPTITINGIKYTIAGRVIAEMKEYNKKKGKLYEAIEKFKEEEEKKAQTMEKSESTPNKTGKSEEEEATELWYFHGPLKSYNNEIYVELEKGKGASPVKFELQNSGTDPIEEIGEFFKYIKLDSLQGLTQENPTIKINGTEYTIDNEIIKEMEKYNKGDGGLYNAIEKFKEEKEEEEKAKTMEEPESTPEKIVEETPVSENKTGEPEEKEDDVWGLSSFQIIYLIPDLGKNDPFNQIKTFIELKKSKKSERVDLFDIKIVAHQTEGLEEKKEGGETVLILDIDRIKKLSSEKTTIFLDNKNYEINPFVIEAVLDSNNEIYSNIAAMINNIKNSLETESFIKYYEAPILFCTLDVPNEIKIVVEKNKNSSPTFNMFTSQEQTALAYYLGKQDFMLEQAAKKIFSRSVIWKNLNNFFYIVLPDTPLNNDYEWRTNSVDDLELLKNISSLIDELYADQHLTEFAGALNMTLRS